MLLDIAFRIQTKYIKDDTHYTKINLRYKSQVTACQKRSRKAAFYDIMKTGEENAETRSGTTASNRDAVCGHAGAKGTSAAEDRRSGGFHADLRSGRRFVLRGQWSAQL